MINLQNLYLYNWFDLYYFSLSFLFSSYLLNFKSFNNFIKNYPNFFSFFVFIFIIVTYYKFFGMVVYAIGSDDIKEVAEKIKDFPKPEIKGDVNNTNTINVENLSLPGGLNLPAKAVGN